MSTIDVSKAIQISVFVEDKPGSLNNLYLEILNRLKDRKLLNNILPPTEEVTIDAYSLSEQGSFGVFRFVLSHDNASEKISTALLDGGFAISSDVVLKIRITGNQNVLHKVAGKLSKKSVNIEYGYESIKGLLILKVDKIDADMIDLLKNLNIT